MTTTAFNSRSLLPLILAGLLTSAASAQAPLPTPPSPMPPPPPPGAAGLPPAPAYAPAELDRIVSPIALYPDPLLAQVLAAATFWDQIPEAARWADDHHYLTGNQLTSAIAADQLPWDPSVQALLPFPSVLDMMASAVPWTQELGNAFLANRAQVMDAVQRMRQQAQRYGYLQSNGQIRVTSQGPYVEIQPVDPSFIVVPYYDPAIVFGPPPPRFVPARAISFGYGVRLGVAFAPWGWGTTRFGWPAHTVIINNAPWGRLWVNRGTYVHPYPGVARVAVPRLPDRHRAQPRTERERAKERPSRDEHRH
jgi:uncharacterized protein DUF3300